MQQKKLVVLVASHKAYWMPQDEMYMPVFVGAAGKETPVDTWHRDDDGENISQKNSTFCELTGHYWMWKNIEADVYGLSHYRRHFARGNFLKSKGERVLNTESLQKMLNRSDVIVPRKRNYLIETNFSQYVHAHNEIDLITTRQIIAERCPEYLKAWDASMKRRTGHRFNMFIMKKPLFQAYSAWLFDLLFELENRLDISNYSAYNKRVFGFVSERLLDVWLNSNNIPVCECSVIHMESQKWLKKGAAFLHRKFAGLHRKA